MAEGGALLRRYTGLNRYRGFESLSLRHFLFLFSLAWAQAAAAVDMAETASRIVDRANVLRMERSMAPVSVNAQLQAAAEAFARHMAKTGEHSHTADGRTPVQRAVAAGYDFCMVTENIGYHASSREPQSADVLAERLVRGWRDSPGHRRNIEDAAALETGVGVARDARGFWYVVQLYVFPPPPRR